MTTEEEKEQLLIGVDRGDLILTSFANGQPYDFTAHPAKEGGRTFNLGGQSVNDYPARFAVDLQSVIEVACAYLKKLTSRSLPSTGFPKEKGTERND